MPSMDAWFDETVDSSLRAGTVAAARVVPKHKANSPSTCLSPSACRQLMHVQADVKAGDARGSLASSRSILNEGAALCGNSHHPLQLTALGTTALGP